LTLAEFLVILVIVLLLVLPLPSLLLQPHVASRRMTCAENQRRLAEALQAYEQSRGHFPGYVNRVGTDRPGKAVPGNWLVAVLPYLERRDLQQPWPDGERTAEYCSPLVCPSDTVSSRNQRAPSLS